MFFKCCLWGGYEIDTSYKELIYTNDFKSPEISCYKADYLLESEEIDVASGYLDEELVKYPESGELLHRKGYILYQQKKYREAIGYFNKANHISENGHPETLSLKAACLMAIGNIKEAVHIYNGIKIDITQILYEEPATGKYKEKLSLCYELIYTDDKSTFNKIIAARGIIRDLNNKEYRKYVKYFIKKKIYSTKHPLISISLIYIIKDEIIQRWSRKLIIKNKQTEYIFCQKLFSCTI
ncbi:MAG: tetratricopeptide repeat protein [Prevotella sp.]|jgi:tetratricopeptide (TPR) repeat protein|nr:tetratricopeptide repeat protein [Prevotella sp.]